MQRSFISFVALAGMSAAVAMPISAFSADFDKLNKAVTDARGNAVTSTFGNCVVHLRWEGGSKGNCVSGDAAVTVYFKFNSSELTAESKAKLAEFATKMKGAEIAGVSVVGTADVVGNAAANRRLSEKRALKVAKFLKKKGVVKANVAQVAAKGESEPTTECGADKGKATKEKIACLQNDRRVDVYVNYK